eukprot:14954151-Alexandrium_andersonii.AAC.1
MGGWRRELFVEAVAVSCLARAAMDALACAFGPRSEMPTVPVCAWGAERRRCRRTATRTCPTRPRRGQGSELLAWPCGCLAMLSRKP